jgi:hypothetical protein
MTTMLCSEVSLANAILEDGDDWRACDTAAFLKRSLIIRGDDILVASDRRRGAALIAKLAQRR